MKRLQVVAMAFLAVVSLVCIFGTLAAPASYEHQFRDVPDAGCSRAHLLGTDDVGRDRLSRLIIGTRVSLLLAPAAALLATVLAALIGGLAGFLGGRLERLCMTGADL